MVPRVNHLERKQLLPMAQQRLKQIADYYKNVVPGHRYLKWDLGGVGRDRLEQAVDDRQPALQLGLELDSHFLYEAQGFLKMGLVNLLCHKFLLGGGYVSWAGVTRYYSAFYAAHSLLRLAGKAIVNVEWPLATLLGKKSKPLVLQLERTKTSRDYRLKRSRGSQHKVAFNELAKTFPDMFQPEHGEWLREARSDANYDLLVPAQTGDPGEMKLAQDAYRHDFADSHYGEDWNEEAAEYLNNEYMSYGYEEHAVAEWLKYSVNAMTEVGLVSAFKPAFARYFMNVRESLSNLGTKETLQQLVKSWIDDSVARLS